MASPYPNMSVPGAQNYTAAGQALLSDQVQGETEEERRKRLQALQAAQSNLDPNINRGYGAALSMSAAGNSLFGGA